MRILLAVAGAHLDGQPLNHELTGRDAHLVMTTTTSADYRIFALPTYPPKPGLVRVPAGGRPVEVEVWSLAVADFGEFVAVLPPPMTVGKVTLADGSSVPGFCCEPLALESAVDITAYGGWRGYLAAMDRASSLDGTQPVSVAE